ncbi:hypothetical protein BFF78_23535 [Streptomyces fodineus]|uniref:Uncharacterized protein n=1 Tax=Streptomyces fodineus TaxID=1904616 RepID=A0A1D7YNU5_9ACTN|nr:hypothetical protein [Streptomyces fodineus]AOR37265.1 hypothetical protein BFF78_23535 [Streptomyces fodineus]
MGIESDQVVYEYLSRVGDIAQQRQLPSGTRMRLVSELRGEIDRHRAQSAVDSPAAVRRILDRLGTPDEVVEAAGGTSGTSGTSGPGRFPQPPSAAVPVRPAPREPKPKGRPEPADGEQRAKGLRRVVPRSRPRPAEPEPFTPRNAPSPPHLAGAHELGDSAVEPDWWRLGGSPFGVAAETIDSVPGFVGGVEIPELLKRPPKPTEETAATQKPAPETVVPEPDATESEPAPRRRLFPRPAAGWTNPLLLLAAAALIAGAVLGNWFALLLGWAIAYGSRRLTPAETKVAVMVLPGAAIAAGLVWLWGRVNGRWGTPIAQGHMNEAVAGTWPWVVRAAAITSALYLVWRSQRTR